MGQAVDELEVVVVPGMVVTDVVDVSCILVKKEVDADADVLAAILTAAVGVDAALVVVFFAFE